jgi:DNA polymerase
VFGTGDADADWMFVGEAPGAEEDRQGLPFVGRAGQLLNAMLLAINMRRDQVYIANVLKCRPPNNRDPQGVEVRECELYLHRQVALIQPKIIVAMGRFAAQSLLKTTRPINKLRGQRFCYRDTDIPLIVTYHPAYLLRSPIDKRKAWSDLLFALDVVANP